jgi:hypothetical protein
VSSLGNVPTDSSLAMSGSKSVCSQGTHRPTGSDRQR